MQTIGTQVTVKIVKNKHAPPFKSAVFELEFGKGIARDVELIDLGIKHKLIRQAAAFYYINDKTIQGRDAFKRYLSENVTERNELETKLREKLLDIEPEDEKETSTESVDGEGVVAASDTLDEEAAAAAVEA